MSYIFVLLSAVAGAAFGQSYKWKARLGLNTAGVMLWFALVSSLLLGGVVLIFPTQHVNGPFLGAAIMYAASTAIAMYAYYVAIVTAKLGISWTVIQLSVVIPFLVSVFLFGESLSPLAVVGMTAIVAAILLFGARKRSPESPGSARPSQASMISLVVASVFTGITSTSLRVFKSFAADAQSIPLFLFLASLALLAINLISLVVRPRTTWRAFWEPRLVLFSIYQSITNLSAIALLMLALQLLPGYFVFPVRNTLNILTIFVIALTIYREKIGRAEAAGAFLAIAGIAVLSFASA